LPVSGLQLIHKPGQAERSYINPDKQTGMLIRLSDSLLKLEYQ